jgi:hypothetical protein
MRLELTTRAFDTPTSVGQPEVVALIYELLDAHNDTAQLADELPSDPCWEAHLDYLRALQREGRATLARMSLEGCARHRHRP